MSGLTRARILGGLVFAVLTLVGCGGGDSGSPLTGALSINLTDAPVDGAAEVVVVFTGVELHRADGEMLSIDFGASTKSIDLIKLQDGVTSALTQNAAVPAGNYDWMRLKVLASKNSQGESYIKLLSGQQYPLWIPSGSETGLKLVRSFTVARAAPRASSSTSTCAVDPGFHQGKIRIHHAPGIAPDGSIAGRQDHRNGRSRRAHVHTTRRGHLGVDVQRRGLFVRGRRGDAG
jgi:hypothetical protein